MSKLRERYEKETGEEAKISKTPFYGWFNTDYVLWLETRIEDLERTYTEWELQQIDIHSKNRRK